MTKDFIDSPFWTLPQAIVWIACRDAERASKDALSPKNSAHEAARAALWELLRSGEVRANGKRNGERREIQPVEWLDLALGKASARPFLSGGGHSLFPGKKTVALASIVFDSGSVTSAANESKRGTVTYSDVRVARDGILRAWPAKLAEEPARKRGPRGGKTRKTVEDIKKELRAGKSFTEKQESLAERFDVSRSTFKKAYEIAMSEFQAGK